MVTRRDYNAEQVKAARSVLLELMLLLGEFREHLVLVGGWVPEFLITNPSESHVGSMDVDLAIDHRQVTKTAYRTIRKLLLQRGYEEGEQPYIFKRRVGDLAVEVDLLAGEYGGTGKSRRHQRIPDTLLRKARGCDIAFTDPESVMIEGELPKGGKDTVRIKIASIESFLCMKGMALDSRFKEKDAWDIYFCVREFPGGLDSLVERLRPKMKHGLMREAFEKIASHFASPGHRGPKHVADFEDLHDDEERASFQRDAFERIQYLLDRLGVACETEQGH